MKRPFLTGGAFILAALAAAPLARGSYYVHDEWNAQSTADPAANDAKSFVSGNLVQTSLSGGTSSAANGLLPQFGGPVVTYITQQTFGSVSDKAEIGALHVTLNAHSDTGLGSLVTVPSGTGAARTAVGDTVIWSDSVDFHSNNPAGSDFVLSLHVDDFISATGQFYFYDSGSFSGSVLARVDFTNSNLAGLGTSQALVVQDIYRQSSDPSTNFSQTAPSHDLSVVIHVNPGQDMTTTITGKLVTTATAQNGTGDVLVDAGNTALFTVNSTDPLASYTTSSGTVFAASVPEPGTVWLLAISALLCVLPTRRQRYRL